MSWTKEPPIQGRQQPCLHAGVAENLFPPDGVIASGFGLAVLTKGRQHVYDDERIKDGEEYMTGTQAEEIAAKDPDHDWRIYILSPMSEREWQRQGPNQWVLIKQGNGFA